MTEQKQCLGKQINAENKSAEKSRGRTELLLRNRLSYRQAKYTLLMGLLLGFMTSVVQVHFDWNREQSEVAERTDQLLNLVEDSAIQAAYQLDIGLGKRLVSGLVLYPLIHQAEILDDRGEVIARSSRALEGGGWNWLVKLLPKENDLFKKILTSHDGDVVGTLSVQVDVDAIVRDFITLSGQVIIFELIRNLVLALILLTLFLSIVTRPLMALVNNLKAISSRDSNDGGEIGQLRLAANHQHDELGLLARTFNQLWMEQEQAEQTLAEREAYFRAVMEQSAEGLYLVAPTGEFADVNRQACVGLGYSREELLKLRVFDINPQMTPIRLAENLTRAAKGEVLEIESVHRRKDGTTYPVDVRVAALELNGEMRLLASVRNITERKEAESHIKHLAYYDSLTDLPNRSLLQDRLKQALATAIRHQHVGALLFLDLDRFKNINDSLGHEVGDELLKQVADRLRLCLREEDTASRLGGDEFVMLATELSDCPEEAAEVAIQIVQKVLQIFESPFSSGGHELYVTASIGVSLFPLEGPEVDFTDLLRQADTAMYRAKDAGRNGFHFYQPEMQEAIRERLMLEKDMHRALEREEFVLFYQPQVDGTGRLIGAEALLRWNHPEKGLVPPDKFIPVAEETGLILPLGQWVINEACSQLVRWKEAGLPASFQRLAINISPRQFVHEAFVAEFRESLIRSKVDPCYLELELTESMLVDNVEDAIEQMNQLKALGLRFSIDDFGTGYSSLRYLQHLPVEQLKIDQSFVRELTSDSSSLAIVEAIIAMSQLLKLQTIAEGVETEAELGILNSLGCEAYQGYYFGRPVPEAEFASHLNTGLLGR